MPYPLAVLLAVMLWLLVAPLALAAWRADRVEAFEEEFRAY